MTGLGGRRGGALFIDRRVDGIEHAADEKGAEADAKAILAGGGAQCFETEISPGAGAIEEEFDLI